jgi:hypothetical protein
VKEGKYLFVRRGSSYVYLVRVRLTDDLVAMNVDLGIRYMKNYKQLSV